MGRQPELDSGYPWLLIGLLWPVAFVTSAARSTLIAVMPRLLLATRISTRRTILETRHSEAHS